MFEGQAEMSRTVTVPVKVVEDLVRLGEEAVRAMEAANEFAAKPVYTCHSLSAATVITEMAQTSLSASAREGDE